MPNVQENDFHRAVAALLVSNVIALIQLLGLETSKLGTPLNFAVFAFSVSIPCLSFCWNIDRKTSGRNLSKVSISICIFGVIAGIAGLVACFNHFSNYAGGIFLMLSIVVMINTLMEKPKYAINSETGMMAKNKPKQKDAPDLKSVR